MDFLTVKISFLALKYTIFGFGAKFCFGNGFQAPLNMPISAKIADFLKKKLKLANFGGS